jgi:hypothetical protein
MVTAAIYRIPLRSPAATAREIKTSALMLEPVLQGVEIKHPLVCLSLTVRANRFSRVIHVDVNTTQFTALCSFLSYRSSYFGRP